MTLNRPVGLNWDERNSTIEIGVRDILEEKTSLRIMNASRSQFVATHSEAATIAG